MGTGGKGAVFVGEKCAVLVRQKEPGGDRIDPQTFTELDGEFRAEVLCPVGHGGLGHSIAGHAGERTESRLGGEVYDGALAGLNH